MNFLAYIEPYLVVLALLFLGSLSVSLALGRFIAVGMGVSQDEAKLDISECGNDVLVRMTVLNVKEEEGDAVAPAN